MEVVFPSSLGAASSPGLVPLVPPTGPDNVAPYPVTTHLLLTLREHSLQDFFAHSSTEAAHSHPLCVQLSLWTEIETSPISVLHAPFVWYNFPKS